MQLNAHPVMGAVVPGMEQDWVSTTHDIRENLAQNIWQPADEKIDN